MKWAVLILLASLFWADAETRDSARVRESGTTTKTTGSVEAIEQGTIVVSLTYGPDGKVAACKVTRSNAPFALEAATVDYIRKHWVFPLLAGDTMELPIVFAAPHGYWDGDLPPPPDLYPDGEPKRHLTLRLTFGSDGWVGGVEIKSPSGNDSVDRQTAIWIKAHWHHASYAGQVIDAPFEFARVPPPPLPKPVRPAPPAEPAEPAGIPAIRVQ